MDASHVRKTSPTPMSRKSRRVTRPSRDKGDRENVAQVRTPQGPASTPFKDVLAVLGRIFRIHHKGTTVPTETNLKEFCVGLLENPKTHKWWEEYQLLGKKERIQLAGSLFLARKLLPSPPSADQAERHASLMKTPASPTPPGYLTWVRSELTKMFPRGWDGGYAAHVSRHTPLETSCIEFSQRRGGSRRFAQLLGKEGFSYLCHAGVAPLPQVFPVKYAVVQTGGKARGVTVSSGWSQVLAPLHRVIYDRISTFPWLLRGDAKASRFRRFQTVDGEVFVSGDYESATDGLSCEVAEVILDTILSTATRVPEPVKAYARRSLRALIHYPDGSVVSQARGQLMGNFLSFPLLCLQNFLAFRRLVPRSVPVKINGDDIVFRCRPDEYERWAEGVGSYGLKLSRGKTMVSSDIFSLNSSYFQAGSGRVRHIPVVRASMLVSDNMPGAGAFVKFTKGWTGESRRLIGGLFLKSHKNAIQSSGRSVVEGLGIPADNSQLYTANLHAREAWYRGSKAEFELRGRRSLEVPIPPLDLGNPVSERWARVPRAELTSVAARRRLESDFQDECGAVPWNTTFWRTRQEARDTWWREVSGTGLERAWVGWQYRTLPKMRQMGVGLIAHRHTSLRDPRPIERKRGLTWVPKDATSYFLEGPGAMWPQRLRDWCWSVLAGSTRRQAEDERRRVERPRRFFTGVEIPPPQCFSPSASGPSAPRVARWDECDWLTPGVEDA